MPATKRDPRFLFFAALLLGLLFFWPFSATGQQYPTRPITLYCGYNAGASVDITIRALAISAEKRLGVPVVVENKPGGGATVCTSLIATKKPDGYTLGAISSGALTIRPHLMKLSYNPLQDLTFIANYARYIGGICVLSESPIKTIDEFIAYAKAHPGLSYGSSGVYTADHLAMELFSQCKGLNFKHVPTKAGSEPNTLLLGRHLDFVPGVGPHMVYVKKGVFRLLAVFYTDKRNPKYPSVPTLKELGCQDVPPTYQTIIGPKGIPGAITRKLDETFKKAAEEPAFQELLASMDLPYEFRDRAEMEKEVPLQSEWFKDFLKKMGAKKEG